jgi:hypothetical protein
MTFIVASNASGAFPGRCSDKWNRLIKNSQEDTGQLIEISKVP